MAEGYGFGGEGDWKTSALLAAVKAMGAGGTRGSSFMEDYTYHFGPGEPKILGAHMLEVCPSIARTRRRARSTRSASATVRIPSGWCSTPLPAPRRSSGWSTSATGSGWWPT
jgi:L-arabinose isomerase